MSKEVSESVIEMPKSINGYVKITNKGEIDVNALLLLGATSKRGDDTKIGHFGSGLKYAMAVLLKNEIPFHIYSGEKEIKVGVSKQNFRGVEVEVIKVNNRLTSLTTDMGPDWEAWFAIREMYCNAIDEGGHTIGITNEIVGKKGETNIYVKFDYKLAELFSNWNLYFSDKRTDIIVSAAEHGTTVLSGNKSNVIIYRKGVRCHIDKTHSLYHYDLTWVNINESRVLADSWSLNYNLAKMWGKMATKEMIADFFDNYSKTFESALSWSSVSYFNQNWLDVIKGRVLVIDSVAGYFGEELASNREGHLVLPSDVVESLKSYFGKRVTVKGVSTPEVESLELPMSVELANDIKFAIDFLEKGGIDVKAVVKIYNFQDSAQLGEAVNGEIHISPKAFERGRREVIMTLLEENCHLQSSAGDKTRRFQEYLLMKIVNLLEKETGIRV